MSEIFDPFENRGTGIRPEKPAVPDGQLTGAMLQYLKEASPWLRFMGILGFISSGLIILTGLFYLTFVSLFLNLLDSFFGIFSSLPFYNSSSSLMFIYALYFIGAGVLTFFPAFFTFRFGVKIRNFLLGKSERELEQAFRSNKSLWKFKGILAIVSLAVVPVMVIIGVVALIAAAAAF